MRRLRTRKKAGDEVADKESRSARPSCATRRRQVVAHSEKERRVSRSRGRRPRGEERSTGRNRRWGKTRWGTGDRERGRERGRGTGDRRGERVESLASSGCDGNREGGGGRRG